MGRKGAVLLSNTLVGQVDFDVCKHKANLLFHVTVSADTSLLHVSSQQKYKSILTKESISDRNTT